MSTYKEYGKGEDVYSGPAMVIAGYLVMLISGAVILLLAIRFLLSLFGADRGNAAAGFFYSISHPFVEPFLRLFNYRPEYGAARFEVETLIAAAVYAIIAALIITFLSTPTSRDSE